MIPLDIIKKIAEGMPQIDSHRADYGEVTIEVAEVLANAIGKTHCLQTLHLTDILPAAVPIIAKALEQCQDLRYLRLSNCEMNYNDATALADAIRNKPKLETVALNNCLLDDRSLTVLAGAMATCPNLKYVKLAANRGGKKAGIALAKMMRENTALEQLWAPETFSRIEHTFPIANAVPHCRRLAQLDLNSSMINQNDYPFRERLGQAFRDSGAIAPNLIECYPPFAYENIFTIHKRNLDNAERAEKILPPADAPYARVSARHIGHAAFFSPGIQIFVDYHQMKSVKAVKERIAKLEKHIDAMPQWNDIQPVTVESLTTPNGSGRCALENPRVWEKCGEWLPQLGKDTLPMLQQSNRQGETFLSIGLATDPEQLVPLLRGQGIHLNADLLVKGHSPSQAMEALIQRDALPLAFSAENWKHQPADGLARAYHSLPEEAKNTLPHYARLRHDLLGKDIAGRGR